MYIQLRRMQLTKQCYMHIVIEKIIKAIKTWASNLPFRVKIYFFGSRLKNIARSDSDVDIALEFLDSEIKHQQILLWFDNHDKWEQELSNLLGVEADLELYENDKSPKLKKYLDEASEIIYDSIT